MVSIEEKSYKSYGGDWDQKTKAWSGPKSRAGEVNKGPEAEKPARELGKHDRTGGREADKEKGMETSYNPSSATRCITSVDKDPYYTGSPQEPVFSGSETKEKVGGYEHRRAHDKIPQG